MNVHPQTNKPTAVWDQLSKTQKVVKIKAKTPSNPVSNDKVRIVCMSDTHSLTSHIRFDIPDGDIFIHAGDFSRCGQLEEVLEFNDWLGKLPHKYKIVIAGNHELSFDHSFTHPLSPRTPHNDFHVADSIPTFGIDRDNIARAISCVNAKSQLTNCIYLQDSEIVLYGIKFYGTPWQPEFHKWAFNLPRGISCLKKWDLIPDDTDVLITHTPPLGHGDLCCTGVRAGCVELLTTVQQRVKPKYHVFGHIHEGYGITSDGKTIFVNASTCDILYTPMNPPIVFDISLPSGLFYSFFKSLVGKDVVVELKNDLSICGTLHSVDQYLNIKLTEISVTDPDKYPHMLSIKNCFIRGSVVRYVQLPADEVETQLLQDAARKEAASQSR